MKLPDSNNIYSTIKGPIDFEQAEKILMRVFPKAKVWVKTSKYKGAKTLHVQSDEADFEGYPMGDGKGSDYLFNGALAGSEAQIIEKIKLIHQSFEQGGFSMTIEAYDNDNELVVEIP